MADNEGVELDSEHHGVMGALLRGWPALLFAAGMVIAAVIAYLPRHYPPSPPTRVHPDDMIVMDVAAQDGRYIAVGELGNILLTDNPGGKWHEAEIETQHSATLTAVHFVADGVVVAIGHSGWIIRSEDGGKTWTEVRFDKDSSAPLLGIAGPYNGKLFAVGAFSKYLVSTDLGRTWTKRNLDMKKLGKEPKEKNKKQWKSDGSYNPFAAFIHGTSSIQAMAQMHYYDIAQSTSGTLFLVGERGLVARSRDNGKTWAKLEKFYDGSFYGAVPLPNNRMLIYGMRGHVYVTADGGKTWQRSELPVQYSLFAGTRTEDGRIVLAGGAHTILVSNDGTASFALIEMESLSDIADILHISGNTWLTAGIGGIDVTTLPEKDSNESRSRS